MTIEAEVHRFTDDDLRAAANVFCQNIASCTEGVAAHIAVQFLETADRNVELHCLTMSRIGALPTVPEILTARTVDAVHMSLGVPLRKLCFLRLGLCGRSGSHLSADRLLSKVLRLSRGLRGYSLCGLLCLRQDGHRLEVMLCVGAVDDHGASGKDLSGHQRQ